MESSTVDGEVRYALQGSQQDGGHVAYRWAKGVDATLAAQIIELMRETTGSAPVIGFGKSIADAEAEHYIAELRANLAAGKCQLLSIHHSGGALIGLCTLRRNLNPNNRHITDLAKGMIAEAHRGGIVLPCAFLEIVAQCERDGVELLTLDVRAGTPAHRTWTRFGFESYGVLADYARADGQVHAGHFMSQTTRDLKARILALFDAKSQARTDKAVAGSAA